MTSAWLTSAYVASGPSRSFQSRTASAARAAIAASPSPSGNTAADGWAWTTRQSGSFVSSLNGRPVQLP